MTIVARSQATITDINDARQVVSFIGSSRQRQVLYNPNDGSYSPNYSSLNQVLTPQLFIAGTNTDISANADYVKWYVQANSTGAPTEISSSTTDYLLGTGKPVTLTIRNNVLQSNASMTYICEMSYTDTVTSLKVIAKSSFEIVKLSMGMNGQDGTGADAVVAVLTNDSHIVPSDSTGSNQNVSGATSTITVYEGNIDVTNQYTVNVAITGLGAVGTAYTLTNNNLTFTLLPEGMTDDVAEIRWTLTRTGYPDISKAFTLTRTKDGINGQTPTSYWLIVDANAIKKDKSGNLIPSSISIKGASQTGTGSPSTSGTFKYVIGKSLNGTSYTDDAPITATGGTSYSNFTSTTKSIRVRLYKSDIATPSSTNFIDEQIITVISDGVDGYTPVKGTDYFDGVNSYLWVRYSQNADGSNMVTDPTNAKYVGIATTTTATAPASNTSYQWSLIKGTDGVKGETGVDGRTSYLHIKYSDDGTTFTANSGETVGAYIGTYVDFNQADSMTFADYTWNKVRGNDGANAKYTIVTGELVFRYSSTTATTPINTSITLSATAYNITTPSYQWQYWNGTTWTNLAKAGNTSSSYTVSYNDTEWGTNVSRRYRCLVSSLYSDEITLTKLYDGDKGNAGNDGVSALTIVLSNESHSIPTDSVGNNQKYTNSGTNIYVYEGSNPLIYDGSGTNSGTWKILSAVGSNITASTTFTDSGDYAIVGDHTNMTQDTAIVTYTIQGKRGNGNSFSLTKVQTLSKARAGYTPVKGTDYFDGKDGVNGVSSFLWVRYSQNSNGNPMVSDPTGALYIGISTTQTATAPIDYTQYTWSLIKGADGLKGETGADGKSSYLHIKYSNDGGKTFTTNNGEDVGSYIGTYVDFIQTDSTNIADYTWNKVRGDNGLDALYTVVTGEQTFKYSSGATTPTNTSISLVATAYNIPTPSYQWQYYNGTVWTNLTKTGNNTASYTVAYNDTEWGTKTYIRYRCIVNSTYSDETTITKLYDGSAGVNALTVVLSNESHAIPTDFNGYNAVYDNSGTSVYLYEGTTPVQYDGIGTTKGTWKFSSIIGTGITPNQTVTDSGSYATIGNHSNMTTDTATITYTITGTRFDGTSISLTKIQSLSKAKAGYTPVKGTDYFDGKDGNNGASSYMWIRYSQNADGSSMTTTPTNAKYIGVAVTTTNSAPSQYTAYQWSLIKGTDGIQGEKGIDGKTSYLHIKYSNDGATFTTNNGEDVGSWIGTYVDFTQADSLTFTDYTWNKVKGNDGYTPVKGTDYFDGKDGKDGSSSFLWIKYSKNANGSGMTTDPTGALYIGVSTTTTATAPTDYTKYTWSLIKGADGVDGEAGADGQTSYLHIKYSNDGGVTFTANGGEDVGDWIGTYVDFTQADSTNVASYTWNKVKGENSVRAVAWTPDGNIFKNNEGILTVQIDVYEGSATVTPTSIKWYAQDTSATNGWTEITSTTNFGITNYANNSNKITVPASAVTNVRGFKAIARYDNVDYTDVTSLTDVSDSVFIRIDGLTSFTTSSGTTTLKAIVLRAGQELDSDGSLYNYDWYIYDASNQKTSFHKTGKSISASKTDISGRGNLTCEVTTKT